MFDRTRRTAALRGWADPTGRNQRGNEPRYFVRRPPHQPKRRMISIFQGGIRTVLNGLLASILPMRHRRGLGRTLTRAPVEEGIAGNQKATRRGTEPRRPSRLRRPGALWTAYAASLPTLAALRSRPLCRPTAPPDLHLPPWRLLLGRRCSPFWTGPQKEHVLPTSPGAPADAVAGEFMLAVAGAAAFGVCPPVHVYWVQDEPAALSGCCFGGCRMCAHSFRRRRLKTDRRADRPSHQQVSQSHTGRAASITRTRTGIHTNPEEKKLRLCTTGPK